ncbi:MAG: TonB-dependent receptor [Gammaproteobacteria bacterium]
MLAVVPVFLSMHFVLAMVISLWAGLWSVSLPAVESELEEVIITGVRAETLARIPRSVTVITADEIARAASNDVVSLLAREANLNIRSVTGNDKFSGIDIRGMGDTFSSNVVVLVDGVRLNAPDLSGPDFSAVSLGQIERIEVIRGGGGVRYGNGAVGGVINIITKKPTDRRAALSAQISYGSFNTAEARVSLSTTQDKVALAVQAVKFDSDGFRHNGDLRKDDFSATLNFDPLHWLQIELAARYHKDKYGLPGSISREAFVTSSLARRQSNMPNDKGQTTDRRYRARLSANLADFGELSLLGDYRSRDNPFVIGFTPLLSIKEQQSKIRENSNTLEIVHHISRQLGLFGVSLGSGYSLYSSRYAQRRNGIGLIDQSEYHPGSIDNRSAFADLSVEVADIIVFNLGYRKDKFDIRRRDETLREFCDFETVTTLVPQIIPFVGTIFRSIDTLVETNCREQFEVTSSSTPRWKNEAYEFGLVVTPMPSLNIFASHSQSFRNPNVDELTFGSLDLRPQRGTHWDAGFRFRAANVAEISLALFRMDVDDEIFFGFDPVLSQNRNTNLEGTTKRRGGELELRFQPLPQLRIWGSYGFIRATNADTGASIPLVAEDTYSLGGRYETDSGLSIEALARYTGPRFDGNDFDNESFRQLDAYTVVDTKLSYRSDRYQLSFGINNLFNEIYATSVYSGTYFPMPGRNIFTAIGISL